MDRANGRWVFNDAQQMSTLWPGASFRQLDDGPFEARVLRRTLSRTRLEGIAASPYGAERTPALARSHPSDIIAVAVVLAGRCVLRRNGEALTAVEGDVFVHRSDVFSFECPEQGRTFRSIIPPALVPQLVANDLHPFVRCETTPLVGAFVRFAHEILRTTSSTPLLTRTGLQLEQALVTLQRGVVEEALIHEGAQLDGETRTLLRAMNVIEQRLNDPALAPEIIANEVGISRRQLFKIFEGQPESVSATVRRRRIESASRDLDADPTVSVQDIAFRYGFPSRDTFARAFKAHHGRSVTQYRSEGAAETPA